MSNQVLVVKLVSLLLNFILSVFSRRKEKHSVIRGKLEEITRISDVYRIRLEVVDSLIAYRKIKADRVASLMLEVFTVFISDERSMREFWTKTIQELLDGGIVFLDEDIDYIINTFNNKLEHEFNIVNSDRANWMCQELREDFND